MNTTWSVRRPDPSGKCIIGIGGLIESGKGSFGSALYHAVLSNSDIRGPVEMISMADERTLRASTAAAYQVPMKYFVERELKESVHPQWNITPRQMLRNVGEKLREVDPDHWAKVWKILVERSPARIIICDDIRRSNEIDAVRELGGALLCMYREGRSFDGHVTERLAYEAIQTLKRGSSVIHMGPPARDTEGRFLSSRKKTPFDLFYENRLQLEDPTSINVIRALESDAARLLRYWSMT